MRLICPNCGAQYEVPDSVIPQSGRDVQCSSCGNTWFQRHPLQADAAEPEDDPGIAAATWDDGESVTPDQRDSDHTDKQSSAAGSNAPEQPTTAQAEPDQAADDLQVDDDFSDEGDFSDAGDWQNKDDWQDDDDWQDEDDSQTPKDASTIASTADESGPDDEWQGFPKDPGLTDAPQTSTRLVKDPEDPVPRLPDIDEDDYEEDPARDLPTPRRSLDTSVADMLREEAEREARARAAERGAGLESQPDLGLDTGPTVRPAATDTGTTPADRDAMRRMDEAQMRKARLKGEDPSLPRVSAAMPAAERSTAAPEPAAPPVAPPAAPHRGPIAEDAQIAAAAAAAVAESRRGLLPDIEEINSSLRSTSDRRPARADDHDTPGKTTGTDQDKAAPARSFNRGFSVTLLIAMILLALYVFAPALAEAVPAIAPTLDSYVSVVDDLRILLDAQFQNLSRWLADIAGSTG